MHTNTLTHTNSHTMIMPASESNPRKSPYRLWPSLFLSMQLDSNHRVTQHPKFQYLSLNKMTYTGFSTKKNKQNNQCLCWPHRVLVCEMLLCCDGLLCPGFGRQLLPPLNLLVVWRNRVRRPASTAGWRSANMTFWQLSEYPRTHSHQWASAVPLCS